MSLPSINPSPLPVAVVTGAGGIGLACARRLGTGHHILLSNHREPGLSTAAEALREEGYVVTAQLCDVASLASVQALAATAASLGRVAAIVHTGGVAPDTCGEDVDRLLQTNLVGTAYMIDEFLPLAGPGTSFVAIASMAGHHPLTAGLCSADLERHLATAPADALRDHPELAPARLAAMPQPAGTAYVLTRKGNLARVRAMAGAYGRKGARLNSVSPGIVVSKTANAALAGASGAGMVASVKGSAGGRWGTGADMAGVVAFLCGPEAGFLSGIDILADGGMTAGLWVSTKWAPPPPQQAKEQANGGTNGSS